MAALPTPMQFTRNGAFPGFHVSQSGSIRLSNVKTAVEDKIICSIAEDIYQEDSIRYILIDKQFKAPLQRYEPLPGATPVYVAYIRGLWYACKNTSLSHQATSSSEVEHDSIPSPGNSFASSNNSEASGHSSQSRVDLHRHLEWLSSRSDDICGTATLDVDQIDGKACAFMSNEWIPLSTFQPVDSAKSVWIVNLQGMAYHVEPKPKSDPAIAPPIVNAPIAPPAAAPPRPEPIAPDQSQVPVVYDLDNDRDRAIVLEMEEQRRINELEKQAILARVQEIALRKDHVHVWKDSTKKPVVTNGPHTGKWGGALNGHHCCGQCKFDARKLFNLNYLARDIGHCNGECGGKCTKNPITQTYLVCSCGAEQLR